MITHAHAKEDLGRSYVQAVGAKAGLIVSINGRSHDYGIDGTFHQVALLHGKLIESGINLDFQLKSTTVAFTKDEYICFPLDVHTVNLLSYRSTQNKATPAILILYSLPAEPEKWLEQSENELIQRNCCYWSFFSSFTTNIYSATVKIPRSQMLTPEALQDLLEQISCGMLV
ncbi:MAG TPA: DUF4365 domain-containing protein [Rhabdochlamydiaceae bacterium]|nr:DUF4365 domain-containing protein [Rhabdochlamydiaceae bacterium]